VLHARLARVELRPDVSLQHNTASDSGRSVLQEALCGRSLRSRPAVLHARFARVELHPTESICQHRRKRTNMPMPSLQEEARASAAVRPVPENRRSVSRRLRLTCLKGGDGPGASGRPSLCVRDPIGLLDSGRAEIAEHDRQFDGGR